MLIGQKLKEIRESKNLSQGDIEQRTGLLRCYTVRHLSARIEIRKFVMQMA
jgi:cytoskeletal protein RodZ